MDFLGNRLIYDERNYDPMEQKEIFTKLFGTLTGTSYSQLFFYI